MYNDAPFLPACLDSLLGQTMGDLEIIAVDDASTDGTAEIAAGYAERDSRVRLTRHAENANSFQTRLTGLEQATGEFVFCSDADDVIPPGAFAQLLNKAEQSGADIVHGRMDYLSGTETRGIAHFFEPFRVGTGRDFVLSMLRNARGWSVVNKLFSRRTVERALPAFPRGRHWFSLDDLLASCLLGLHAEGYAALNEVTYLYRIPPVTHSTRAGGFEKWANDTLGIMTFFEEAVAANRGEGPLLEGVRGYMRDCMTGLLAEASQSPEAFAAVSAKIRATALPPHVRWAEDRGLFDIGSAKRKGKTGLAGRLRPSLQRARDRGLRETYLRLLIKLRARRMEREYKAARSAPRVEETT
jgi:hypothetical protein